MQYMLGGGKKGGGEEVMEQAATKNMQSITFS